MEEVCQVLSSWSVAAGFLRTHTDDVKTLVCELRLALRRPKFQVGREEMHQVAAEMAPICSAVRIDWSCYEQNGTDFYYELCREVDRSVIMQKKFAHLYVTKSMKRPFCSFSGYCVAHFSKSRICILATADELDQQLWEWVGYTVRFGWSHWFDTPLCLEDVGVTLVKAHKNPRENAKQVAQLGLLRSDICK